MIEKSQKIKEERKRILILYYDSFGSKLYAPLTRDEYNLIRNQIIYELNNYSLTTYDSLSELESEINSIVNTTMPSITKQKWKSNILLV